MVLDTSTACSQHAEAGVRMCRVPVSKYGMLLEGMHVVASMPGSAAQSSQQREGATGDHRSAR